MPKMNVVVVSIQNKELVRASVQALLKVVASSFTITTWDWRKLLRSRSHKLEHNGASLPSLHHTTPLEGKMSSENVAGQ